MRPVASRADLIKVPRRAAQEECDTPPTSAAGRVELDRRGVGESFDQVATRSDAELGVDLAQVVGDRVRADVELRGDLDV